MLFALQGHLKVITVLIFKQNLTNHIKYHKYCLDTCIAAKIKEAGIELPME